LLCPGKGSRAGGIGRFVAALTTECARIDPSIEVRVLDTRGSGHILFSPYFFGRALLSVMSVKFCGRPALLHLNSAERGSTFRKLTVSALASALRLPTVVHLHAADYERFLATLPAAGRRCVKWMFRRSSRVVVLGEAWRRSVVTSLQVPADRVVVIPNGVKRQTGASRCASEPWRILFLGRLEQRKGVKELISALADPRMRALPWHATLAGDGDAAPYKAQAEALAIGNRISFPGWLSGDDVGRLLTDATILTLPSYAEGLPMAVIESLATGVPVVTTPVGSLADFLVDGSSVLFVPPGDVAALSAALFRLMTDSELRRRIGEEGQAVFERNFSIGAVAGQFIDLWRQCLALS
jgi:glycosyltransferase involved in cell wall biosynthesis